MHPCPALHKHTRSGAGSASLSALAALAMLATGCGRKTQHEGTTHATPGSAAMPAPEHIACGSPAVTEIVYALGCGERVVGVSDYCTFPPQAQAKPRIGGWLDVNRERLLVLKPDMILTQGNHESLADFCRLYNIRMLAVPLSDLNDIFAAIHAIARALGVPKRGAELSRAIGAALDDVRTAAAQSPSPRVLLLLGRTPGTLTGLSAIGPGSFINDLLAIAHGTNVFADAKGSYPQVSKEALIMRAPQVIVELNPEGISVDVQRRLRSDWERLPGIPAADAGRIHYLTNDYLLIPGPRIADTARRLAEAIHGEAAP